MIMKKIIAVFLCILMAVLPCTVAVNAIDSSVEITEYPVIMVAGYTSSALAKVNEDGTQQQIWGLDFNEVIKLVLKRIVQIGIGIGALTQGNAKVLADVVGKEFVNLTKDMKCNPDGTSKENVQLMFPTAESSNAKVMYDKFGDMSYQFETEIMGEAEEYIGMEKVYNFNVDFRRGAVYCANELDNFIQQVKERDNVEKVNILAVSHGGQVTATYLNLYGYKQDVDNACLTVPAIGGACLLYDILAEDINFDELNLLNFIESGMMWEDDWHWLVEAQELGFLDDVLNNLVPYLFSITGNWGSVWDFCPSDIYEEMKAKWLDPVENAQLIKDSDYMHYTIMPSMGEKLRQCIDDYGMNVSIVAGTDINSTTGKAINADGVIFTSSSTGATCADYGKRFPDGYTQINDCGGKNKVSPSMTVDASTAYLPDNTWFVSGLFHGMTFKDDYTEELMMLLTLTDELTDVYSSADYPQFHQSSNPSYAVWAAFGEKKDGFVSSDDSYITIRNLSRNDREITILGITADGMDLDFDLSGGRKIPAGGEIKVPFTGTIPQVSGAKAAINIVYRASGTITPYGQRTLDFTVVNGEKAASGSSSDSAFTGTPIESSIFSFAVDYLKQNNLFNLFSLLYSLVYSVFTRLSALF